MARFEDQNWLFCPQTPLAFGLTDVVNKDSPVRKKCIDRSFVVVFYLDSHLEICDQPLPPDSKGECEKCVDRVECLTRQPTLQKVAYHEPLNECPPDPHSHPAVEVEGYGGPYGCPLWCMASVLEGGYAFPV